jgi:hypothetical protein
MIALNLFIILKKKNRGRMPGKSQEMPESPDFQSWQRGIEQILPHYQPSLSLQNSETIDFSIKPSV